MVFRTEQEDFWAGEFGDAYVERSSLTPEFLGQRTACMARMIQRCAPLASALELGCNRGVNLAALSRLTPATDLKAVEINAAAADEARALGVAEITHGSLLDFDPGRRFDLVLISGVLIHLDPSVLEQVYRNMFDWSQRYVLMFEYYNPTPVEVRYRGHEGRLFKRDFAGEMLDLYPGQLRLVDYGFFYHRDVLTRSDDGTWFLMEKV